MIVIRRKKKSQSIVEYALIGAVVIGAMVTLANTVLRPKLETDYANKLKSTLDSTFNNMNVGVFKNTR